MPKLTIELTDARYAALSKTQELMLLSGGTAKTPEEYAQFVMNSACDSYAQQFPADAPSKEEVAIHAEAAARAEAALAQEKEKAEAATAQLAELLKLKEENGQPTATADPA